MWLLYEGSTQIAAPAALNRNIWPEIFSRKCQLLCIHTLCVGGWGTSDWGLTPNSGLPQDSGRPGMYPTKSAYLRGKSKLVTEKEIMNYFNPAIGRVCEL